MLVENRVFSYDPCSRRPRYIAIPSDTEKLEWSGYPTVKKFEDMFNRFDRIPACDGLTDRQTSCDSTVRAMQTRRAVKTEEAALQF